MPRRRPSKKSKAPRRTKQTKNMYQIARSVVNRSKEMKMWDTSAGTLGFSSVGSTRIISDLASLIPDGTDYSDRETRNIVITGVHLSGVMTLGDNVNVLRMVLCDYPSEDTANFPSFSTLSTLSRINGTLPHKKYVDKLIVGNSNFSGGQNYRRVRFFAKMNKRITYRSTAADSNIQGLFLSMVSDSTVVTHPGLADCKVQIFFHDA